MMSSLNVQKKSYGVDLANWQDSTVNYPNIKFALVKVTEGTNYVNPKAAAQIKSAKNHGLLTCAYFYANHSDSVTKAKAEARFAVAKAKSLGVPLGSYLADDFENGDGNSIYGYASLNTDAVLAAMAVIKESGYKPLVYASASVFRNNLNISRIIKNYGTCLWVASYKVSGRQDYADFNYFPSMDGVAIWQFCDNWKGLKVDGNISLIDLHDGTKKSTSSKTSKHSGTKEERKTGVVYAPVINHDPNWKIKLLDGNGHYMDQYIKTNTRWKYFDVKTIKGIKCYQLGTDKQWAPAKYLKEV